MIIAFYSDTISAESYNPVTKEKGLSPKDEAGLLDPTPFEAVKRIIRKEKAELAEK